MQIADLGRAVSDFTTVIEIDSKCAPRSRTMMDAHYNIAMISYQRGDLQEAIPHLQQAVLIGDEEAARMLGTLTRRGGHQ